jgi:hypothetical protein
MPRTAFKQADVERMIRAARAVGIQHPSVEIRPDGAMRLLTDEKPKGALTPLQEWERQRGLSGA